MKTASTAAIAAIHNRSRNFRMKLVFSGFEVTTMEYFSTNTLSCSSSGLTFGTAAIGAGEFKVKKDTNDFADKEFTTYVGILVNDVREWVKIGKYHITEVEVNGIEKTVSFEDDISKLDKTFTEKLTYPVTAQTMLGKIATLCGVTFDMTAIPSSLKVTYDYTDVSCRTIVSQIAQMVGTFVAYDSSADKIAFKWYTNTNYIIKKSDTASENKLYMIDEPEIGEQFCLDMLVCNTGKETFTSSADNATGILSFTNPMMTQAQLNSLFSSRKGFTYNDGRVAFKLGNPLLDVWDIVTVEYMGKTAVFPCMNVNFTYTGGITANIQTYVRNEDTAFEGQITKEFREVKTQITAVDGKVSSKVSKGDIISEINQSAEKVQIKAEKIELDGETIADKLTASSAKIGGWTIKDSKIYAGDGTTIKTAAVQAPASGNMWVFAAGGSTHDTYNDCPFRVDRFGRLYCTQANVSGTVNATGGKIGGWTINKNILTNSIEMFIEPTINDYSRVESYVRGVGTLSATEITAADLNCDGVVNHVDSNTLYNLAYGTMTWDEAKANGWIANNYQKQNSTIALKISPLSPDKTVAISGKTSWGTNLSRCLGIYSPFSNVTLEDNKYEFDDWLSDSFWLSNYREWVAELIDTKADKTEATQTEAGLMSAADKTKLDNVPSSTGTTSKALTVQANGSQVFTFNGSAAKTLNIKAGTNVTLTSDTSGNITINARSGTGTGDVGDVLYEATNDYGIYCDGKTTLTSTNSVTLNDPDPNGGYKRFRIYVRTVYGLACTDMPVDRPQGAANSPWGSYQGGIVFPTGDISNGATLNYLAKIHWRIIPPSSGDLGWKFQVTDSGWVNIGTGAVSQADYTDNKSIAVTNAAPTWNQRHNNNYSVYKIVGYII